MQGPQQVIMPRAFLVKRFGAAKEPEEASKEIPGVYFLVFFAFAQKYFRLFVLANTTRTGLL